MSTEQQEAWDLAQRRWPALCVRIRRVGYDHVWVAYDRHDHVLGAVTAP